MRPYPYIAIEGPIGVGKTTLARLLQPEFEAQLLLEVFEENPFLAAFYQDRPRYAFQTQVFFLLSRYRQQHEAIPEALRHGPLISDYTFSKDKLFAYLNLSGDELDIYEQTHAILAERILVPDLVIYLRADTDVLIERIALRDRPYERDMDRGYIDDLNRAYEGFFAAYTDAPTLPIDTNRLNLVHDRDALYSVVQRVRSALGTGVHQRPLPELELAPAVSGIDRAHTLPEFQKWHRVLDEEKGFLTDLYFNFVCLQEEVGELASELLAVWAVNLREGAPLAEETFRTHLPAIREELADCLAYIIKLANYAGVDLEEAYREKMKINVKRKWRV